MKNKNLWGKLLNLVITVLTAVAAALTTTSCMN